MQVSREEQLRMDLSAENQLSWIEMALMLVPGMTREECELVLPDLMKRHQMIASRMASHLALTCLNVAKSSWLSAQVLSMNADSARTGARLFHQHLIRLQANTASPYDAEWLQDEVKMAQLADFADMEPPCLVWRNRGVFRDMFIYLADRFLGAPDSVLDAEGVHARWKWVEHVHRRIEFSSLNAVLRLNDYITAHGDLPPDDETRPHLETLRAAMRLQYDAMRRTGVIAKGLRDKYMSQDRFNLSHADVNILKEAAGKRKDATHTPQVAWGNYVRFLFQPHSFYSFSKLGPVKYLRVAENKSLPGRDQPAEGSAMGRFLMVAWFEKKEQALQGIVVSPVAGGAGELELMPSSIAEISRAAGFHPPVGPEATEREVELLHEQAFLQHGVLLYTSERVGDSSNPWSFVLSEPRDPEDDFIETRPQHALTKMGLARSLQVRDGLTDKQRDDMWSKLSKDELLVAFGHEPGVGEGARDDGNDHDDEAPGAAQGRGRGRGRARAPAAAAAPAGGRGRGPRRARGRRGGR